MNLGIDIGRHHDATIIAGCQLIGDVWHLKLMKELTNTPYTEQEFMIRRYLGRAVRCRIDETGIGNMLAENLRAQYGSRVEPITFTNSNKDEMITNLKVLFEQRKIRIPNDQRLITELHDLNRLATPTSVRYDTSATDHHCDRVWALALAVWETDNAADPSRFRNIVTRRRR